MDNDELMVQFDAITKQLRESGADLSRIVIALKGGSTKSYVTKRLLEDMKRYESQVECSL